MSDENVKLVEAALFTAGKPVAASDLEKNLGLDQRTIRAALNKLVDCYEKDDTAIEVVKIGAKYSMQVKGKYKPKSEGVAPPEIPKDTLKIASLIGYYQPILQSKLSALAGPAVYDGVKKLVDLGFVKANPKGRSFELTTTQSFIEYFGIEARTRAEVKSWFAKKLRAVPEKD